MTVAFFPKRLLITALFLIMFGAALTSATDLRLGLAVGAVAMLAYLVVEVLVFFNPAPWRARRNR